MVGEIIDENILNAALQILQVSREREFLIPGFEEIPEAAGIVKHKRLHKSLLEFVGKIIDDDDFNTALENFRNRYPEVIYHPKAETIPISKHTEKADAIRGAYPEHPLSLNAFRRNDELLEVYAIKDFINEWCLQKYGTNKMNDLRNLSKDLTVGMTMVGRNTVEGVKKQYHLYKPALYSALLDTIKEFKTPEEKDAEKSTAPAQSHVDYVSKNNNSQDKGFGKQ